MTDYVRIPKGMVIAAMKGELDPAILACIGAIQLFPDKKPSEVALRFELTLADIKPFKAELDALNNPPVTKSSSNGLMPFELSKWLRDELVECFADTGEHVYVPSKDACAEMWAEIYADSNPKELLTMALTSLRDIHDNQMQINSPAAFLKRIVLNDSRDRLEEKMRLIEEHGTAIHPEKVTDRARRLRDEELARGTPATDPAYAEFSDDEGDDE